jgi:hypothetical protein
MNALPLFIGFSLPFQSEDKTPDQKRIDEIVRQVALGLPEGALLQDDARLTMQHMNPYMKGEASEELKEEDFKETWQILESIAPKGAGIRLGVGDSAAPHIKLEKSPEEVRLLKRKPGSADELLYGPR